MKFASLYKRISPRLKKIAQGFNGQGKFFDADDLYQEMSIYLWENYKDGVPAEINEAYILKGCHYHILNYLRKNRENVPVLSLEETRLEDGVRLEDILAAEDDSLYRYLDRKLTFEEMSNNGFIGREKDVFTYLLKGYTVREIGKKLNISHVMVVKFKQRIIKKWQGKNRGYQKR